MPGGQRPLSFQNDLCHAYVFNDKTNILNVTQGENYNPAKWSFLIGVRRFQKSPHWGCSPSIWKYMNLVLHFLMAHFLFRSIVFLLWNMEARQQFSLISWIFPGKKLWHFTVKKNTFQCKCVETPGHCLRPGFSFTHVWSLPWWTESGG